MRKPSSIRLLALAMGIALPLTSAQATNSTSTNPNVICRPAKWTDVVVFYLGNYVAHAATTLNLPGQSPLGVVFVILAALFFPISGVFRGFRAISTLAIFAETELQTAARAGALCMVVELDDRARYEFEGGESESLFAFLASLISDLSLRTDPITFDQNPRILRASRKPRVETGPSRSQI
jgi:hypothetical protein